MRTLALTLTFLSSAALSSPAKSDVDVYIISATGVEVTADTITIRGSAITRLTTISDNDAPDYGGLTIWGRPADSTLVKSDDATFVIHSPRPGAHNGAWKESVAAAEQLQAGKPVGRIGYYTPGVTIKAGLITGINGHGYLYTNRQSTLPVGVTPKPSATPSWGGVWWTRFANGVNQRNTMRKSTARGGNDHGWSSTGSIGHHGDRVILTYRDDRIERWTPVNHHMVVEHWHPASNYPDGKPVVGIASRTSWETPE